MRSICLSFCFRHSFLYLSSSLRELTQEQLGEKAGISYKFIGEVERGAVNPSLDSLVGIAKALRVGVRELFPSDNDLVTEFSHEELEQDISHQRAKGNAERRPCRAL